MATDREIKDMMRSSLSKQIKKVLDKYHMGLINCHMLESGLHKINQQFKALDKMDKLAESK